MRQSARPADPRIRSGKLRFPISPVGTQSPTGPGGTLPGERLLATIAPDDAPAYRGAFTQYINLLDLAGPATGRAAPWWSRIRRMVQYPRDRLWRVRTVTRPWRVRTVTLGRVRTATTRP